MWKGPTDRRTRYIGGQRREQEGGKTEGVQNHAAEEERGRKKSGYKHHEISMLGAQPGLRVVANCGLRKETSSFGPFWHARSLQPLMAGRGPTWPRLYLDGRGWQGTMCRMNMPSYTGLRFARIRCKVRRCIVNRRAVSETLRSHNS